MGERRIHSTRISLTIHPDILAVQEELAKIEGCSNSKEIEDNALLGAYVKSIGMNGGVVRTEDGTIISNEDGIFKPKPMTLRELLENLKRP